MSVYDVHAKRDSLTKKITELDQRIDRLEYLLNEFIEVNKSFVDKTLSLDQSFMEQIQKYIKIEVFSMKAMLQGYSSQKRLRHIEIKLLEMGILEQSVLDKNKQRDEEDCKLIEERFLEEGI